MKRLLIDLEACYKCKQCTAGCSYLSHPENKGIISLLELVSRAEICRKCKEAPCVNACPNEALERQPDGVLKRYGMRCTGCESCVLACPFGAIYPEIVPFLTSQCDYCLGSANGDKPECVKSCPEKAVQYVEVEESKEKDIRLIGDKLAVHALPWRKE